MAALMGVASIFSLQAAIKDLPVTTVQGQKYHYYDVTSKETVYSLCYKLGISKDELIRNNPAVADGLRSGMKLFFPVETAQASAASQTPSKVITHHVQKGETIFGIAHKYGVTTDDVIAQNPVLKDGLKAGQTITVKLPGAAEETVGHIEETASASLPQPAPKKTEIKGYVVKKKETFYSIAVSHGLSVAELEAANPGVNSLREGQVLNIPVTVDDTAGDMARNNDTDKPNSKVTITDAAPVIPVVRDSVTIGAPEGGMAAVSGNEFVTTAPVGQEREISVAVMLPFMLKEENPSKSAMRYTEFYKGFLLAVDSLRNNGAPIHVTAYDTEGSVLNIKEALTDSTFRRHDAIIAPDNASQLAILAEYGRNNNVKVFNTFLVKDDTYLTNPSMMQCNLPSALMYRKAADALMERLSFSTPVFVSIKGVAGDKADFVETLKESLSARGKTYMEVEVDGRLDVADLRALPSDGNYTFIPTSARQADLNKLMPGIIEWRDQAVTPVVRMFGYPEWTTFRGETLENMHNLNTTVYSRFYTDEEAPRTADIDDRYKKWYGGRMENAIPRQGLLGFDTGMFIIPYLTRANGTYDGVQNGYFFTTSKDGAGAYNEALYFVNFRPGNVIDKSRI